jgi:hypothetical protein
MTLPEEEARAIAATRTFLYALLDPRQTPRVPREVRQRARRVLKHYPLMPPDPDYVPWAERITLKGRKITVKPIKSRS